MAEFVQYGPSNWLVDLVLQNEKRLGTRAARLVCGRSGTAQAALLNSKKRGAGGQTGRAGSGLKDRICGIVPVQLYFKGGSTPGMPLPPASFLASAAADRWIHRAGSSNWCMHGLPLLILAEGALIFSTVADYTTPLIQRIVLISKLRLTMRPAARWPHANGKIERRIDRKIGSWVRYCGEGGWTCLTVERLLGRQYLWFCQAVDDRWRIAGDGSWPTGWSIRPRPEAGQPQGLLPLIHLSQRYRNQFGRGLLRQRFFHS